ncbi:MAG: SRPBCC family protein [Nakamurella sp.]
MRLVTISAFVPGRNAVDVFSTLADYARYPELTPVVRSVDTWIGPEGELVSKWEVNFRTGILRWTERDILDQQNLRIDFEQVEGDVAEFTGSWQCAVEPTGTAVRFESFIELGIPSLADVLDPIAARTLLETISSILLGLFGDTVRFDAVVDHGNTSLDPELIAAAGAVR